MAEAGMSCSERGPFSPHASQMPHLVGVLLETTVGNIIVSVLPAGVMTFAEVCGLAQPAARCTPDVHQRQGAHHLRAIVEGE